MPFEFREIIMRAEIQRDADLKPSGESDKKSDESDSGCGSGMDAATKNALEAMKRSMETGYFPGIKTWKR